MRATFLLLLFAFGLVLFGAAIVRSGAPVSPLHRFSISERLQALRLDRVLPPDAPRSTLAIVGNGARFSMGTKELFCPTPAAYLDQGCVAQAVGETDDVRIYDLHAPVPTLCPGQSASPVEDQLQAALYLPARELLQPGELNRMCNPGQSNCALALSADELLYCGDLRAESKASPGDLAASLSYAQSATRPSQCRGTFQRTSLAIDEAVTPASAAPFAEKLAALPGPGSAETAKDVRAFFAKHSRGVCFVFRDLDVTQPRDLSLAERALAFPVFLASAGDFGATGPFHLKERDDLHLELESDGEVQKTKSTRAPLTVAYQPLSEPFFEEKRASCGGSGVCLFPEEKLAIPEAQGEPSRSRNYLARLYAAWSAR